MGKKYVVMEVKSLGDNFIPANTTCLDNDYTRIDPRHVIDGDRLRYGIPNGETILTRDGWIKACHITGVSLILDPPKPEGDKWEKWVDDCPILKNEGMNEVLKNWFRKMPRGK